MHVFMTSAAGHVGSAVADALLDSGHQVSALARSPHRADQLEHRGITAIMGELAQPSSYAELAAQHEAILHTAFEYDAAGNEVRATEVAAIEGLLTAARQSTTVGQLVYTSSVFLLGGLGGHSFAEDTSTKHAHPNSRWRLGVEDRVLAAGHGRLSTAVLRLGVVYGANSYSMSELFTSARKHGSADYPGAGTDRWPLIYRGDLATLFVAVVEQRASGIFHAVDGVPLSTAEIARLASEAAGCDGRTHSQADPVAANARGEHHERIARDVPAISLRTRDLGWSPSVRSFREGAAIAFAEWRDHPARVEEA